MSAFKTLLANFQRYHRDEQRILHVISVISQPRNITDIRQVLHKLNWQTVEGLLLDEVLSAKLRDRWVYEGILILQQNTLHCNSQIAEFITRETLKEQTYTQILAVVELLFPELEIKRTSSLTNYEESKLVKQRKIRNAFYLKDEVALLQHLEIISGIDLCTLGYERVSYLIQLCTRPFDTEFFASLSNTVKVLVICPMLQDGAYNLDDMQTYFDILQTIYPQAVKEFSSLNVIYAQQLLWRGKTDQIESLLNGDDSSAALTLMGWLKFQQSQPDAAISYFETATKRLKKESHKRNIVLPEIGEALYLLALLQRGDQKSYQQIAQHISVMLRASESHYFEGIARKLQELADIQQGNTNITGCYWLNHTTGFLESPLRELFNHLILFWAKGKVTPSTEFIEYHHQALKFGWYWYSWVSNSLIANSESPASSDDFVDLSTLFKPVEPWKAGLKALRAVNKPIIEQTDDNNADLRMAWGIYYQNQQCILFPREQKRNARSWSKGRPIALQKLHEDTEQYPYLNAQDQRIIQCITTGRVSSGYGYTTVYDFAVAKALKVAIGHPLLFWSNESGSIIDQTPLELTIGEPVLELLQHKQELVIKIVPWILGISKITFTQPGKHKLNIIEFNPQQQQIAKILGLLGLTIPKSAKQEVLESISAIAPLLTVHSDITGIGAVDAEEIAADTRPVFQLEPAGMGLSLDCYVQPLGDNGPLFRPGLGAQSVLAEIEGKSLQTQRHLQKETEVFNQVINHCPLLMGAMDWEWQLEDPEEALETLLQLQALTDTVILSWPKGKKIQLSHTADLSHMQVSIKKQQDWFSLQGELQYGDNEVIEMMRLLQLLDESPGRFLRLGENQFIALSNELRKRLGDVRHYSNDLRFHTLATQVIETLTEGMQLKHSKPWKDQLNKISSASDLVTPIPSTFQAQLRDYQEEGFQWLSRLAHLGAGACLADDMGLGKTIQALAVLVHRAAQGPALVLAPSSVILNWMDEAQRFAPTLNIKRFGSRDRQKMLEQAGAFDLILCSYGLLQTEYRPLAEVSWHTLIADEAQAIKNVHAKRSKAAMTLKADFRVITTGTPVENHLGELWNLFQFINPGLLGSLDQFNKRFANPIEVNKDRNAQRRLKNLIQPFILRRLKTDVLTELPPRTEITLRVDLSTEEMAMYEALRRKAVENLAATDAHPGQKRIKMLAEIMRLRRACCHPQLIMPETDIHASKLQAFSEIITEMQNNGHKALVFSQFVDHLHIIKTYLQKQNVTYQYLDGSTPLKQRKIAIDAFQSGIGEVFLISLKAGGVGLNLTAADYVIHMDPWWNPAVEDQASDRAHRIGQQRPVTIYRLVASNTIEEKIVELHSQKRDLADNLLEGSEISGKMSVEAMLQLIEENQ